jgi:hypothetical protein
MADGKRFYEQPIFWPRLIGGIFLLLFGIAFRSEMLIFLHLILAIIQFLFFQPINPLSPETPKALLVLLANLAIFLGCYFILLKWFSLFVLPAHDSSTRYKVYEHLVEYIFGLHGPAVFVKNGDLLTRKDERPYGTGIKDRFASLAFVDLTSAIVLESKSFPPILKIPMVSPPPVEQHSLIRVLGPGICFLHPGERIRGSVDLRKQFRTTKNVRGFTSDGIELETNVNVTFTLGQPPDVITVLDSKGHGLRLISVDLETRKISISDKIDEGDAAEITAKIKNQRPSRTVSRATEDPSINRPPFVFDENHIISAVISQPRNTKNGKLEKWSDLPSQVAVTILLDELSRVSYDDLYSLDSPEPDCYLYDIFKPEFSRKMKAQGVLSCQFAQRKDGSIPLPGDNFNPTEYVFWDVMELHRPKPIRDQGIKIIDVDFSDFKPVDSTIPDQRFDTWRSRWQKRTELTNANYDLEIMRNMNHERSKAQREIIYNLSQIFKMPGYTQDTLAIRIFQALESAAANPATNRLLPRDTLDMLRNFQNILFPTERSGQGSDGILATNDDLPPGESR